MFFAYQTFLDTALVSTTPSQISCSKSRVVSRQPIRSPPLRGDDPMTSRAKIAATAQQQKKAGKPKKRRTRKNIQSVM